MLGWAGGGLWVGFGLGWGEGREEEPGPPAVEVDAETQGSTEAAEGPERAAVEEESGEDVDTQPSLRFSRLLHVFELPQEKRGTRKARRERVMSSSERKAAPRRLLHRIGGHLLVDARPQRHSARGRSSGKSRRPPKAPEPAQTSVSGPKEPSRRRRSSRPRHRSYRRSARATKTAGKSSRSRGGREARPGPRKHKSRRDSAVYRWVEPNTPVPPELASELSDQPTPLMEPSLEDPPLLPAACSSLDQPTPLMELSLEDPPLLPTDCFSLDQPTQVPSSASTTAL